MSENKNDGKSSVRMIGEAITAFIALTMLGTMFIPILGVAEDNTGNNTLTVYGTVEDEFGVPSSWFLG